MKLLLDTCAVIWIGNDEAIAPEAEDAVTRCRAAGEVVLVSPITAWELGILVARGRLRLSRDVQDWLGDFVTGNRLADGALTPAVLAKSSFLPPEPPRDPADRILIATAREEGLTILTRDRIILNYAAEGHVQAIEC